jgi:hypothetical protein
MWAVTVSPGDAEGSAHGQNPQPLSALLQGQQGRRSGARGPQSGPWPTACGARDSGPRGWLRYPGFLSIRAGVHPMLHDATPLLAMPCGGHYTNLAATLNQP